MFREEWQAGSSFKWGQDASGFYQHRYLLYVKESRQKIKGHAWQISFIPAPTKLHNLKHIG
jgi:hypothetical protein